VTVSKYEADLVTYRDSHGEYPDELHVIVYIDNHKVIVHVPETGQEDLYVAWKPSTAGFVYTNKYGVCEVIRLPNNGIKVIESPNIGATRIAFMYPALE